jgi:molybdopterin/thiamine biosynthesis adenylyltransferase
LLTELSTRSVLLVGLGGLGCPVAWILARAGVGRLVLVDDDEVDETNLHRQVLFDVQDVGQSKLSAARAKLLALGALDVQCEVTRLVPENARHLARGVDLIVEGADNYATKFLVADTAHLEQRPVVHGAALGWRATAWAVAAQGQPCYRCLFEDLPTADAPNCNTAGVMGPVVGFGGALMAELALGVLVGKPRYASLMSYDGKRDVLRQVPVSSREGCGLCGPVRTIFEIDERSYSRQICAA